jgi:pimeloyl-ACP methyl ester carboxylesterase
LESVGIASTSTGFRRPKPTAHRPSVLSSNTPLTRLVEKVLQGHPVGDLTRDDILDNITLYWLTNTGISSARLYWENKADFFNAKNITIPFAISVFPDELYAAPRSWAERAYPKLIHYNRLDKGGHFAAWEQPALLAAEIRSAFKSLR